MKSQGIGYECGGGEVAFVSDDDDTNQNVRLGMSRPSSSLYNPVGPCSGTTVHLPAWRQCGENDRLQSTDEIITQGANESSLEQTQQGNVITTLHGSIASASSWERVGLARKHSRATDLEMVLNQIRTLEQQHDLSKVMILRLHRNIKRTRAHIKELKLEKKVWEFEIEKLTKKLAKKVALDHSQEQVTGLAAIRALEKELDAEKKSSHKVDSQCRKATEKLSKLKIAIQKVFQDLGREREGRELMEGVCDELAQEIAESRPKVVQPKQEYAEVLEHVDKGQKMPRMVDVWCKIRVQMKIAKVQLQTEEMSANLDRLWSELEACLRSKRQHNKGSFFHGRSALQSSVFHVNETAAQHSSQKDIRYQCNEPGSDGLINEEYPSLETVFSRCSGKEHQLHNSKVLHMSPSPAITGNMTIGETMPNTAMESECVNHQDYIQCLNRNIKESYWTEPSSWSVKAREGTSSSSWLSYKEFHGIHNFPHCASDSSRLECEQIAIDRPTSKLPVVESIASLDPLDFSRLPASAHSICAEYMPIGDCVMLGKFDKEMPFHYKANSLKVLLLQARLESQESSMSPT